ncbi:MAG: hypothetical protein ACFFE4_16170 [Candidatus Thorarchaeota archaeon]
MIDDKIDKYRDNLNLAQNLANNRYADHEYYEKLVIRLEKMLKFYENLKNWKEFSEKSNSRV